MRKFLISFSLLALVAIGSSCETNEDYKAASGVRVAYEKFRKLDRYYCFVRTIDSVFGKRNPYAIEMYELRPDKFWLKVADQDGTTETMVIGKTRFAKDELHNGNWYISEEGPPKAKELVQKLNLEKTDIQRLSDFEALGDEVINGEKTFIYGYTNKDNNFNKEKMWVSSETGLPVRLEIRTSAYPEYPFTYNFDYSKKVDLTPPVAG